MVCTVKSGITFGFLILVTALSSNWHADAAQVQVNPISINMFRHTRGANDVGLAQGDRLQFGANVTGGSLGTTIGGTYPPTGFTVTQSPCDPLAVNPNFCTRTTNYNANRLAQPWTIRFEKTGFDPLEVTAPPLLGVNSDSILQPVPFPVDVTISGSGSLTPTISWNIPGGFAPDGFRINIYDKRDHLGPDGRPDIIHSPELPNNATSYTLPAVFADSGGLSLVFGGLYTIDFQIVETRNHVPFVRNADILRSSSSYFAFSPLDNNAPPNVVLPTVVDGVYNFFVTLVGPNTVTFIDPPVAIGYDYAIGSGNPNFASVVLPEVGNNQFNLYSCDGASLGSASSNVAFNFAPGGVSCFRVRGIETSAGLNPQDATAFITGLTFVSEGSFTGTMTPIIYGDVNGDRVIDMNDVNILVKFRNQPATSPDDLRDLNHDGVINALDSRILTTLCTNPRCAVQQQ